MDSELSKAYEPSDLEKRILDYWLQNGCFRAEDVSDKPSYCIVIPPPNVTGSLHVGHALDNTLQDILIRWKRMSGYNALWMPGTDHAGIATEVVLERKLKEEGLTRYDLRREKFIERLYQEKDASRGTIVGQLMRLGASCDWERERFTLDEDYLKAVPVAFKRLYEAGHIYRGEEMVNWVPSLETSVSDLEVEHEERQGKLYYIRYPLKDSDDALIVATTRPETMLGDTAVAVNPMDKRYQKHIGKKAILPLIGRELPIIADEYVDAEFGTGALKVTPGHDPNDYEIGKRHGLERIDIFNSKAQINKNGGPYEGLDRFDCRERILKDLASSGCLVKTEDYPMSIALSDRTGEPVEPLVAPGWFMRMGPLAEAGIEAVKSGQIRFIPENQGRIFIQWMENIRDWPLARKRWWGHRIPAWKTPDGVYFVAENEADARAQAQEKYGADYGSSIPLEQDSDVLDTWFSSGIWPLATLGWPNREASAYKTFFPTDTLVTAWDILFFWVSRMANLSLELENAPPFKTVYLHPLLAGEDGQKMSKSRGNTIDPLEMMDKYGTDPLRFAVAAAMIEAPWMQLQEGRIAGARNFANKIWNAGRFVLTHLSDFEPDPNAPRSEETVDRWIVSRTARTVQAVQTSLERFRFADAANALHEFIWHEFCDWHLELAKARLYQKENPQARRDAQQTLRSVFDAILRLLHPFMPFLTEELWQRLGVEEGSLCRAEFPTFDPLHIDAEAERQMSVVMGAVNAARTVRGELNVPPSREIVVLAHSSDASAREALSAHAGYMSALAKASTLDVAEFHAKPPASAAAVVGSVEIYIPLEGVIDVGAETARLEKEKARVDKELERSVKNLSNENFLNRAPAAVVEKAKTRRTELEAARDKLAKNIRMLKE